MSPVLQLFKKEEDPGRGALEAKLSNATGDHSKWVFRCIQSVNPIRTKSLALAPAVLTTQECL